MDQETRRSDELLRQNASDLLGKASRVFGSSSVPGYDSVVGRMATGTWTHELGRDAASPGIRRLATQAAVLARRITRFRADAPAISSTTSTARERYASTLSESLPMNRKERFFTGTVLPGICRNR